MKNRTSLIVASLAVVCTAGLASANTVRFTDATGKYNGTTGGAFVATRVSGDVGHTGGLGLTGNNFYTFCVERNASIQLNGRAPTAASRRARSA
jgi:hypothetical protein